MRSVVTYLTILLLLAGVASISHAQEASRTESQQIAPILVTDEAKVMDGGGMPLEERIKHLGLIIPDDVKERFEELNKLPVPELKESRDRFDWREMDGVTPVKNQADCGSCWDFAATGALESIVLITDSIEWDLSEQQVLSCNTGGSSCDGGWMDDAYNLFMSYGAVEESCMPYEADDGVPCTQDQCPVAVTQDGVIDIAYNTNAIKNALLNGPVSTTFMVYSDFHYNCYWHQDTGDLNHAVVIVGWDDSICSGGGWIVKNSWGQSWGDDGYFYMPYGSCGIGNYTQQPVYAGAPGLSFNYPNGLPEFVNPDGGTTVRVEVEGLAGVPQPGTGMLHYDIGAGWQSVAMEVVSPNVYDAVFPASLCGTEVEFYFSAETDEGEVFTDPFGAPTSVYTAFSYATWYTLFEDNFESDLGWSVVNACADGQWGRGVPVGGDYRGNPPSDYDGSGKCYVTANESGDSDVDDGYTYLISPAVDLAGTDAIIRYALWYTNDFGNDPNNDLFKVYVSGDNGSTWTDAQTFGPVTSYGWKEQSLRISDYITPTNQVKVRFEASDLNDGSVVEAGIDAFEVVVVECEGGPAVAVSIVPDNPPVEVPPGGSFTFTGTLTNNLNIPTSTDAWIMVNIPGFGLYGPLKKIENIGFAPLQVRTIAGITQHVHPLAPLNVYEYICYAGDYPSAPFDSSSFEFTVISEPAAGAGDWIVSGWDE
jgi:C1A family cysteine protease